MKFLITATSEILPNHPRITNVTAHDDHPIIRGEVEIKDLEDLVAFRKEIDFEIILSREEWWGGGSPVMEIYDDYRE